MLRGITASALSSRERKVDSLQSAIGEIDGLQMLLLVLIGRQRTGIAYNPEVSHLKLVGELYDKCQELIMSGTAGADEGVLAAMMMDSGGHGRAAACPR